MRIVYMGNNIRGARCLQVILAEGEEVVGIVAHPEPLHENPEESVKQIALDQGLPLFQPRRINSSKSRAWIDQLCPDLIILAGYNQILQRDIIDIPSLGCINLHGGKLPEYRGVAPINWQLINGETKGGCAILYVDEGIDTGDIIAQQYYDITLEDDASTLIQKTLKIYPPMLLKVLRSIEDGSVKRVRQNPMEGCYYTRRFSRDGQIKWGEMSAVQVFDLVRALVPPYPGAFTHLDGRKVVVHKTKLLDETIRGIAGRIASFRDDHAVVLAADRGILVESIIDETGRTVTAKQTFKRIGIDLV